MHKIREFNETKRICMYRIYFHIYSNSVQTQHTHINGFFADELTLLYDHISGVGTEIDTKG